MKTTPVLQLHKELLAAIAAKNEPFLREHIRQEFLFTSANADVLNKEAFVKGFAMNPALKLPLFEPSGQQVIMVNETAIVTAVVHINIIRGNNAPEELWERITETYIQDKGQWKLLASQATFIRR
ncbi:protein of unknown function [Chitinophaga niabensis]|uniref:DUF4440 domain-containing protein n=2 Tax=Chitinophaga niabensis TaxID=536979 RepID=A0A1N6DYI0_9BACT|nr:protein of unknown function [Chitinophaga niabensis]